MNSFLKIFFAVVILLLVVTDVLFTFKNARIEEELANMVVISKSYKKNNIYDKEAHDKTLNSVLLYQSIGGVRLNNINIFHKTQDETTLAKPELLSKILNDRKLVFRFFQSSCTSCVSEQLAKLFILSKKIGRNKILLLPDRINPEIAYYLVLNKIDLDIYETKEESVGVFTDKDQIPFLCTADEKRIVESPMILTTETKIYSSAFYNNIQNKNL